MNVKNELKSLIARKGTTFKKVCTNISEKTGNLQFNDNNISTKFTRGTIRFHEVELILDELGYDIVFVERK
ncbi:hypothetical protein IJZ97_03520 [bacterium]|nr:hypothetical protein [bacterium]